MNEDLDSSKHIKEMMETCYTEKPLNGIAPELEACFGAMSSELQQHGVIRDPKDCEVAYWAKRVRDASPHYQYNVACNVATIGEPLQAAVAPAINSMMKEMAMIVLAFAPFFSATRDGYGSLGCDLTADCDGDKYPMEAWDISIVVIYGCIVAYLALRYYILPSCGIELCESEAANKDNPPFWASVLLQKVNEDDIEEEPHVFCCSCCFGSGSAGEDSAPHDSTREPLLQPTNEAGAGNYGAVKPPPFPPPSS